MLMDVETCIILKNINPILGDGFFDVADLIICVTILIMKVADPNSRGVESQIRGVRSQSEVSDLKSEVSNLKSEVSDLKSEVSNLKSEVSDLKSGGIRLNLRPNCN